MLESVLLSIFLQSLPCPSSETTIDMEKKQRIVIIGAGPTGLGAAIGFGLLTLLK